MRANAAVRVPSINSLPDMLARSLRPELRVLEEHHVGDEQGAEGDARDRPHRPVRHRKVHEDRRPGQGRQDALSRVHCLLMSGQGGAHPRC